jgi:rhodanese-related sulfurtransferase
MKKAILLMSTLMVFSVVAFPAAPAVAQEAKRMSIEELKAMLGNPDVVVIDVRAAGDWRSGKVKIKGAVREDPEKVESWMSKYPKDKTLVFYCA